MGMRGGEHVAKPHRKIRQACVRGAILVRECPLCFQKVIARTMHRRD